MNKKYMPNSKRRGPSPFAAFVKKEARHIVRDRRTMLILFGMPVVLMLLFGFAITNDVKNVRTVVVTSQTDHLTQRAIDRLAASEYFIITATAGTPHEAEQLIRNQKADLAVVFSRDFASKKSGLQLIVDASDPNMAQQWTSYAAGTLADSGSSPINTKLLYNPRMKSSYNFVPAIMGMLLMLVCAMMTSISIVREKEKGTMEVLLVSPVRPLMIIVAKAVPYLVLLALSLGLLISNIASSQLMALLLSAMVLLMPIVMLSGMLFPIESMPVVLQWVSAVMPPRYYIEAMRKLMIMGVGIGEVAREVAVLSLMTAVLLAVSLAKFKTRLE